MSRRLQTWSQGAEIVQAMVATLALGAGAWWFFVQREVYPRAELIQSVEVLPLTSGTVAVEVHARFENTGKQLIKLRRSTVSLQSVSTQPYDFASLAPLNNKDYWDARRPGKLPEDRQFHAGELRWPIIKQFSGAIEHSIEPGETDILVFTFVVPCELQMQSRVIKLGLIRIATDITKPKGSDQQGYAWKARAISDVSRACGRGAQR